MSSIRRSLAGPAPVKLTRGPVGNTLVFSMRGVADLVAYCTQYEFEDVIVDVTGADRITPTSLDHIELQRKFFKAVYRTTKSERIALQCTPDLRGMKLTKDYDLFIAVFNHVHEIFAFRTISDWRQRCRHAVCVITEMYEDNLPDYLLKSLSAFDRVYIASNPVESVAKLSGRPTEYLPISVDAMAFSPFPEAPLRSVDVMGIGRRSATTHAALMDLARNRKLFYYYDTTRTKAVHDAALQITFSVIDPAEHRFKYANMLKRSRYYMASRARANEAALAQADEMTGRFFEGAAAGTIMLGEPPRSGPYLTLFDWPDAVVACPFDDPNVGDVIATLDADPDRCIRIRRDNLVNALLRHDCAYRVRTILERAGLSIPPALLARESRLKDIADYVRTADLQP